MPLHRKRPHANAGSGENGDIFTTRAMERTAPDLTMPDIGIRPDAALAIVRDELGFDGNPRQNLATFCQTWVDDEVHTLMNLAINRNLVDRDEYPATAEMERRCVHMIAALWNADDAADPTGCSTVGSSEAAMLGGLALKRAWQKRRGAAGGDTSRPNLVTGPVQVCWHKFARYFDVELREIPMTDGAYGMTPETMAAQVDENTIGVVITLGVTFTGHYEPVDAIAAALDRIEAERGLDIPIHVDGASGGFLAPFAAPSLVWDFRVRRVVSINASGHKFGLAPLGIGWVLWRDHAALPEELVFHVNYLGGDMPDFALNFSRPGGQVAAQYYLMLRLGHRGYSDIHGACYDIARAIAEALDRHGRFTIIHDGSPQTGIPAVSWTLRPGSKAAFSLFDLSDRLRMRGWQVAAYTLVPELTETVAMRVLIRHGFSRDMADRLLADLDWALDWLDRHPASVVADETQSGSDPHGGVHPSVANTAGRG